MRATIVLAFFAFVFTLVGAVPSGGINARRMADGLAPLAPVRRTPSPVLLAARNKPSGVSGSQCNTGPVQCCNKVENSNDSEAKVILALFGIKLPSVTSVGLTCSPVGPGNGNSCHEQSVCCQNNGYNGVVAIGCTPINI